MNSLKRRFISEVALCSALLIAAFNATAESNLCGDPFKNHFGPMDYRTAPEVDRRLVENVHFTPGVESGTKPGTTTFREMAADVAYTLHVFPNHPRALLAMDRLSQRHQAAQPPGAKFTLDCYYWRALTFRPDDTVVRGLYALYLARVQRKPEALRQLAISAEFAKDNPFSHYNIGLLYLELGEPALALEREHVARSFGLVRPELEQSLRRLGHWRDPNPANPPQLGASQPR